MCLAYNMLNLVNLSTIVSQGVGTGVVLCLLCTPAESYSNDTVCHTYACLSDMPNVFSKALLANCLR
jgi:hypothetical protein